MNRTQNHVIMTALMGTRKHLREKHDIPEDQIDPEDDKRVIADHIRLHSGEVHPNGAVTWPKDEVAT